MEETKAVDVTGAFQITDREAVEKINLANLLCQYAPNGNPSTCVAESTTISTVKSASQTPTGEVGNQPASSEVASQQQVDHALRYFNTQITGISASARKATRNALQERLLTASTQRCNVYKGNLQRTFSRTNFNLGALSTIAGTVGALVSAPGAASNWAGVAAISSGSRAEYNQDFMSNLAAYVIVDGIDKRRELVYTKIQEQGQTKDYEYYPVEAAIKDALYFHGQCSVIAGFQQASDSIKTTNEPGLNAAINAMAKVTAANSMMNGDKSADAIMAVARTITNSASTSGGPVGSNLQSEASVGVQLDGFLEQINKIQRTNNQLTLTLKGLRKTVESDEKLNKDKKKIDLPNVDSIYTTHLDDKDSAAAISKLTEYTRIEVSEAAKADAESVEELQNTHTTNAAYQRALKGEIVYATKEIATNYQEMADKLILSWKTLYDKLKAGSINLDKFNADLKASIEKPTLNADSITKLEKLIGLPPATSAGAATPGKK